MKYTVKMSCGHEEEKELFGSSAERERKIQYFQRSGLCKACYKAAQEEREKDNLHGFLNPESFPAFAGSEKQIAWAERIRKEATIYVNAKIKSLHQTCEKNQGVFADDMAAFEEVGRQLEKVFNAITDAGKLIDRREAISPDALSNLANTIKNKKKG